MELFKTLSVGSDACVSCASVQIAQRHLSWLRGRLSEERWFICTEESEGVVRVKRVESRSVSASHGRQKRSRGVNNAITSVRVSSYKISLNFTEKQIAEILSGDRVSFCGRVKPFPDGEYTGFRMLDGVMWHVWMNGETPDRRDCPYGAAGTKIRPVNSETGYPVYDGNKQLRILIESVTAERKDDGEWYWICNFSKFMV